jgi:hypothetical protein
MKIHLLVVGLLFACVSHAQRMVISGTVSDPAGLPLDLVVVHEKGSINGTFTNEKGKYTLPVIRSDSVRLIFSCLGYMKIEAVIPSQQTPLTLDIRMRPQSYELETAVVTASHIQTNTMERIAIGQGRLSVDATGGSIESLIMTAGTGVSTTNELSAQYSVRGGNYNENIVYVNGIEVYRPLLIRSGQQEGLSFINPDMTEAVQFSSGGFEARYGDKMSSVLDITYKKPEQLAGGLSGSLLGGNVYLESATGKFAQITGFRYKRGTTLLSTLDTKGDYEPSAIDLQTYMTYSLSPKLTAGFLGNYSENSYDFIPQERETSYGTIDNPRKFKIYYGGMERDRFRTLFGAATLKYAPNESADISLLLSGFRSHEEETYDINGAYYISNVLDENNEDNIGTGAFLQHARNRLSAQVLSASIVGNTKFNQHAIRWSTGAQQETINDRINEWELRDSVGYSLPLDDDALRVRYNLHSKNDIQTTRLFAYIQDTYKFRNEAGLFSLTAGLRGSYWNYNRELIVSPRASLGFIPARNQRYTFRLAAGIYYQSPFYKEFRIIRTTENENNTIELNRNIQSQRSIHWVLGGDYHFKIPDGRPFKFTTEMYYKKLDKIVPYTVDNVRIWYAGENTAYGYATGIDTKLFGQFVPETDSWIGLSLMQAKQYIDGERVSMPTDQLYNFTMYFSDYMPKPYNRLQANLRIIWAQGLPSGTPGNEYKPRFRAPAYRRVDIGLSYRLWSQTDRRRQATFWNHFKNIWIGADCFNLLDIKNINSYSWFTDVTGAQNAVPNRLTGRQLNIKLIAEF